MNKLLILGATYHEIDIVERAHNKYRCTCFGMSRIKSQWHHSGVQRISCGKHDKIMR